MREKGKGKKNKAGISKAYQDAQDPCSPYRLGDTLKIMVLIQRIIKAPPYDSFIELDYGCND
jgi:hypothetical protein